MNDISINDLRDAQLAHVTELINDKHYVSSDDGYDYLRGALRLAATLTDMAYENDTEGLKKLLDPTDDEFALANHACDGICNAVYEAFAKLDPDWEAKWDAQLEVNIPPALAQDEIRQLVKKQTSSEISSIAAKYMTYGLRGDNVVSSEADPIKAAFAADVRRMAASLVSQDETPQEKS